MRQTTRSMLTLAVVAAALVGGAGTARAEDGWREELRADLVRVEDGKFVWERFSVCRFKRPASSEPMAVQSLENVPERSAAPSGRFQVKSYAEAPAQGVISRDQFVYLTAQIVTRVAMALAELEPGITPTQALDAFDCEHVSAPIGRVDIELHTTMTPDGIQVEFTMADGKQVRATEMWSDFLVD